MALADRGQPDRWQYQPDFEDNPNWPRLIGSYGSYHNIGKIYDMTWLSERCDPLQPGLPLAVQVFDGVHFEADFKGARPWMSTELHGSANDSF